MSTSTDKIYIKFDPYIYRAKIVANYDGDTLTADIDMGMNIWRKDVDIRLKGVDTPELRPRYADFETKEARDREIELAKEAERLVGDMVLDSGYCLIRTYKDNTGKYGRLLADVYVEIAGDWVSLAEIIKAHGLDKNSENYGDA